MKKNILFLPLVFVLTNLIGHAQIVTIPDINFKNKLLNHDPVIDINNDGEIQFSEAEAITETINVSGTSSNQGEITDLTGIEAFINIDELKCEYNLLTTLSLNSNTLLKDLFCDENEITVLNISNNTILRTLSCSNNLLTSLDVSSNVNLEFLQCNFGILETIDVSNNPILHYLYIQVNQLTNLDITNNPELYVLICNDNQLTSLNLNNNIFLDFLQCGNNNLENLDFSNNTNLRDIDCRWNTNLTYINLKNGNNENIYISGSQSSNFENLPSLETVCIDDVNSDLAAFILEQVDHSLTFTEDCSLNTTNNTLIDFTAYPVPTTDFINIQSETSITQIEIYNVLGELLLKKIDKNNIYTIDISNLSKGLYFLKVLDINNKQGVKKVLIK